MKKLLFSAVALATLLFASCQQEKMEIAEGGNTVTFAVEAPGALASKALADGQVIADGTNVNEVHYAVYKPGETGEYALENEGSTPLAQGVVPMENKAATITFDLLKNQTYVVIFWAQVKGAGHYLLGDLRNIALNTTANAEGVHELEGNDETRAAFYRTYQFSTNEKFHEVKLYRPFAQLNLLTTPASLAPQQPGQTSGYTIDVLQSQVTVKGLSTSFNTVTGLAPVGTEEISFTLTDTPAVQGQETLKVNNVDYHYVSMNYFFVPEDEEIVEVSYSLTTDPGENAISNTIINVPVKENYRTNIIGNLLTTATTFEIIVDQNFNEPALPGDGYVIRDNGDGTCSIVPDMDGDLVYHEPSGLFYNGKNAPNGVYYVMNVADLNRAVKYFSQAGVLGEGLTATLELMNDIDLASQTWTPWSVMWMTFNGNNHKISNITTAESWRSGLFGYIGAVTINDLTLENVTSVGAQAGILAGSVESVTVNNLKITGENIVAYAKYESDSYTETWGGIGAVTGVLINSTVNAEIENGAVVTIADNGIVSEAEFQNYLSGYIAENKGNIVNNGSVKVKASSPIVGNGNGTNYNGEAVNSTSNDFFALNGCELTGDANITIKENYSGIIIENTTADINDDFLTIEKCDCVVYIENCDITLPEGKKLISCGFKKYQVFILNVTVNGVLLTQDTAGQYLENVEWYGVYNNL